MGSVSVVAQEDSVEGSICMGCGAEIVATRTTAPGEDDANFSVVTNQKSKSFHQQKDDYWKKTKVENWSICPRCIQLQRYAMEEQEDEQPPNEDTAKDPLALDSTLLDLSPDFRMIDAFRDNVSTIRGIQDAVVIVCVDAINTYGTMLTKIRNYVGGNTILLAVTRCDLLPSYVWQRPPSSIPEVIRTRAEEYGMQPASIYFCSEERNAMRELGGVQQLVHDVWEKLRGT